MDRRPLLSGALAVPLLLAAIKLALHALAVTQYGYFRDELYYIACAKRLAWGYVDQPPLSIALLALNRALVGDSLLALRWLPAMAGAGTVLITLPDAIIVHCRGRVWPSLIAHPLGNRLGLVFQLLASK